MKYRKLPVVIEAVQFTGENANEIHTFTKGKATLILPKRGDDFEMTIPTLEGPHIASPGDYIICGVKGEFYPCKEDIFLSTYEAVGDE